MSPERATYRFLIILIPAMIVFVGMSFGIDWADDNGVLKPTWLYVLALIPIASLMVNFWALWRFMNEIDEYLRTIQIKAVLFGLASILCISTGWGYLEAYADAAPLAIFWLNPIFWVAHGLSMAVFTLRDGGPI